MKKFAINGIPLGAMGFASMGVAVAATAGTVNAGVR